MCRKIIKKPGDFAPGVVSWLLSRRSAQLFGGFLGVVGEDDVGAGAFHAEERLHHDALFVEPAFGGGSLDHGVFARNVVDGDRHVEALLGSPDDVEVGQAGLDHDDVRAFDDVEFDLFHRLFCVGRVHLVGALVAELRRGVQGVAERAVEARSVFGGVRKNAYIGVAGFVERLADRADAAVHHVARRDEVSASLGVRNGHLLEHFDGFVVENDAIPDEAVVAERGERVERDIGHDAQLGHGRLDGADRLLENAVIVVSLAAVLGFLFRDAEQVDCLDAEIVQLLALLDSAVDGEAEASGHGRNLFNVIAAGHDEQRKHEVVDRQRVFLNEVAESGGSAKSSRAMNDIEEVELAHGSG